MSKDKTTMILVLKAINVTSLSSADIKIAIAKIITDRTIRTAIALNPQEIKVINTKIAIKLKVKPIKFRKPSFLATISINTISKINRIKSAFIKNSPFLDDF